MSVTPAQHFEFLMRLADDHLILAHRLSEWCGHAPILEEDLAMPNMALDLIGQSRSLYSHAGEIEGRGRSEDDLAFVRREREYRNCMLVERPNGDFAHTMLKQLYFVAYMEPFWKACLSSTDATLAAIAAKAIKEVAYHIRHCGEWVIRLGDGALLALWDRDTTLWGLPLFPAALFAIWALLIAALAWLMEGAGD